MKMKATSKSDIFLRMMLKVEVRQIYCNLCEKCYDRKQAQLGIYTDTHTHTHTHKCPSVIYLFTHS